MVKRVIYLELAVYDLASIYKYISQDSIKYARLEVQKIKAFIESLKNQPLKGKFYKQVNGEEIRSVIFKHYIVFYAVSDKQINILTIHHHARSITLLLPTKINPYLCYRERKNDTKTAITYRP